MAGSRRIATIVSGLPRSGTSMMMRCLHHSGIPAIYSDTNDHKGVGNGHPNPNGYFEIPHANEHLSPGHVVKIFNLRKQNYIYQVVYMHRQYATRKLSSVKAFGEYKGHPEKHEAIVHKSNIHGLQLNRGVVDIVVLSFEDIMKDPLKEMMKLKHWGIDPFNMASLVETKWQF